MIFSIAFDVRKAVLAPAVAPAVVGPCEADENTEYYHNEGSGQRALTI